MYTIEDITDAYSIASADLHRQRKQGAMTGYAIVPLGERYLCIAYLYAKEVLTVEDTQLHAMHRAATLLEDKRS